MANNDDKILKILESMDKRLDGFEQGQKELVRGQQEITHGFLNLVARLSKHILGADQ